MRVDIELRVLRLTYENVLHYKMLFTNCHLRTQYITRIPFSRRLTSRLPLESLVLTILPGMTLTLVCAVPNWVAPVLYA